MRSCTPFSIFATTSVVSADGWPGGRSSGVTVALVQLPCRSGWPSGVRGVVDGAGGFALPAGAWAATGVSHSPAARARLPTAPSVRCERTIVCPLADGYGSGVLRRWPYISSSTNSTHLNWPRRALALTWRYSGIAIVHGFENVLASSIVASYWMWSGPVIV